MKRCSHIIGGILIGLFLTIGTPVMAQVSSNFWTLHPNYIQTLNSAWGLNVPGLATSTTGCLGVNSTGWISASGSACASGSGTVTSVGLGTPNSTLSLSGTNPVTTSGTINADLNLGHQNIWTVLQTFNGAASTTQISAAQAFFNTFAATSTTATSTIAWGLNAATSGGCVAVNGTCLSSFINNIGAYKDAVNYATVAPLAANTYSSGVLTEVGTGALSVDSSSPSVGQRVLVKTEATGSNNGIYTVTATGSGIAAYVLTRATDFNSSADIFPGVATYVLAGTYLANYTFVVSNTPPITLDTTSLTFATSSNGNITLPLTPTNGGTGFSTFTTGDTLYSSATNVLSKLAIGALGSTGVMGISGGVPAWVATSTLFGTSGIPSTALANTTVSAGSYTNTNLTVNAQGQITSASNGSASSGYDFTPLTNYNVNTNSTTTPIWLKASPISLMASSTAWFDQINIGSSTLSKMATSTDFGNFIISGNASTSALVISNLANITTLPLVISNQGVVSASALSIAQGGTGATSKTAAFDALQPMTNQGDIIIGGGSGSGTRLALGTSGATGVLGINTAASTVGWVATSTLFGPNGIPPTALAPMAVNTVLGNGTGASASPTAIATSSLFQGLTGQMPFFSSSGNLIGTSTLFLNALGYHGIASSTPTVRLSVGTGLASSSIAVAEYSYGATGNLPTSTAQVLGPVFASNTINWPIGVSATTLTLCMEPGEQVIIKVQNPAAVAGALTWATCAGQQLYWSSKTTPTQTTTANDWDQWSFKANSNTGSTTSAILISGGQSPGY